jgi:hypothetical protein
MTIMAIIALILSATFAVKGWERVVVYMWDRQLNLFWGAVFLLIYAAPPVLLGVILYAIG